MQKVYQAVSLLGTDDAAVIAGFGVGIVGAWEVDHPLGSLFAGAIVGTIYAAGASLVYSLFPQQLTPIIPISCACFAVKQILFPSPPTPTKPLIDVNINHTSK